jgi:Na+-translocating ferredoxin:NAD+ oxidoreductase RnfG subunit
MKIILTLLLAIIGFLLYKIYSLTKEKIVEEIDKSCIRLEIPKEIPNFEDYDKDDVLLKDVIESVKLEECQDLKMNS